MANGENFSGASPMWRIASKGISAHDFMRQKNQNNVRAFYGKMWRFAKDQDYAKDKARQLAEKKAQEEKNRSTSPAPLKNELVEEAKKKGLALSPPDTASDEAQKAAEAEIAARIKANADLEASEAADQEDAEEESEEHSEEVEESEDEGPAKKFTESQLKGLPHSQLRELGSSLGVANIASPKAVLIRSIMEKQ